jgi:uncharacterized protein (TIGR02687 family)
VSQQRIIESLQSLFASHRLLFWNDADGEFEFAVGSLELEGVTLIRIDQQSALQVKVQIEKSPASRWLLYSAKPEPEPHQDWLLDLRVRGKAFYADSTSILLEDLGLTSQTLRGYLKERSKFLRAKDRVDRLKRLILSNDQAEDLDRKMLAVLARADQPELFSILLKLFSAMVVDGDVSFEQTSKAWQEIQSNDLEGAFWVLVKQEMGYCESEPSLRDLLFRILVSDFSRSLSVVTPEQVKHFLLPEKNLAANASVFAGRWRSDLGHYATYDLISSAVAKELNLSNVLAPLKAEEIVESMTFEETERRIIKDLKDRILAGAGANQENVMALIARRRDGHWANRLLVESSDVTKALVACYDAIEVAADFFQLKTTYGDGFSFSSTEAAYEAYQSHIFRFDQLYRRFNRAADLVEPMGWAVLQELRSNIENIYSGWFIPQLGSAWSKIIEGEGGLLSTWKISGVSNQQDFYGRRVLPLSDGGSKRIYVIISDALRYEVAEELVQAINSKSRLKAKLDSQLGVLPSYTTLGMASLLPHDTLAYKLNSNLEVLADGQSVATIEQRNAYLARFEGVAIKHEDLLALGKEKGREFARDKKLIYVYHDRIDLIGDKQGSETKTFEAVSDTITELSQLVSFIINSLNGANVLLTADHGFVYQESPLESADKSALDVKPDGVLKAKKRYLLGQAIGISEKAWCGTTRITAGTTPDGSLDFWVPKGAARFHFAGGARFVHGSAMPQEVVVPVITIYEDESGKAKTRQVAISLLGASNKVVNNTQRFEFIQTDPVSERVLARTVLVSLRDGDALISNEQSLTFDSSSQMLDERKRSLFVTVLAGNYDRNKDYFLIARDAHTKVEVLRHPLRIDLAFTNDF